ncbi:MAG: anthranilate synthase component I [Candidatus Omnitrophica bacterium]|nr:anthranilate synthase component I [Candidatus Omnitrophota bacterium]
MIEPNYTEFKKLAKRGNIIPVVCEFPADLETPVSIFLKIAQRKEHAFLLESVELEEKLGRFSIIGMDPDLILKYQNGQCHISDRKKKSNLKGDLLGIVQHILKRYHLASPHMVLPPLAGGLVGYIGYELVEQFEDIKLKIKKGLSIPDSVLFFPTNLVTFDHIKHELKLIHLAEINGSLQRAYQRAVRELKRMKQRLTQPVVENSKFKKSNVKKIELRSNMGQRKFEQIVQTAKRHIRSGDCIQVVLSQRFNLGLVPDGFKLFRALRSLNPSPYMFYFKDRELTLVGSSPEMLAKKTDRVAEIRPIAGTRPRGENDQKDLAYEAALKASPKEMAEHIMLVDLGRNDLGRVCHPQSVRVQNFARVERYSHVMHLVSDIKATLKKEKNAFDLLRAAFPAGTVTGAPKIRAMQIINELETEKRGPYAGSLGYFSLNGDMDMCITIRTIVIYKKQAYVQAGAGIVNDSRPHREFQETINKAKALFRAVEKSRRMDPSCSS